MEDAEEGERVDREDDAVPYPLVLLPRLVLPRLVLPRLMLPRLMLPRLVLPRLAPREAAKLVVPRWMLWILLVLFKANVGEERSFVLVKLPNPVVEPPDRPRLYGLLWSLPRLVVLERSYSRSRSLSLLVRTARSCCCNRSSFSLPPSLPVAVLARQ